MKRILFAYLYCNFGGVVSVIKQRLPFLLTDGWKVHGLFRQDNGGAADLRRSGMDWIGISGTNFIGDLKKLATRRDYDAIVIIDDPEALACVLRIADNVIYEVHTPIEEVLLRNDGSLLAQCPRIVVPSAWSKRWIMDLFPEVGSNRISVVPNIVDPAPFQMAPSQYPTFKENEILWVGKIAKYKNWREMLRIAHLCLSRGAASRITCITGGNTPMDSAIRFMTEAANLEISGQIRWLHNLPIGTMVACYKNAAAKDGVLLSTSLAESFCFVVHEAMRAGLPVVSTSVGAVCEVVRDGDTGDLYEPGDYMHAADLIEDLMRSREMRHSRRCQAHSLLDECFDPSSIGAEYIARISRLPL